MQSSVVKAFTPLKSCISTELDSYQKLYHLTLKYQLIHLPMKKVCLLGLISLLCIFTSCEKVLLKPDPENSAVSNFDLLWKILDENYAYFDEKDINWKAIYEEYRPKVKEGISQEELFEVMADMLNELEDGHVNLTSGFDRSRNWDWYLDYPQNFDKTLLERSYLGSDHQIAGPLRTTVIDSIGYIYYDSFINNLPEDVIDSLLDKYSSLKGIIIDIRNNVGGYSETADLLASRFTTKKILVGYTRYKDGPGHKDFTQAFPIYLEPGGETQFTKPVVILTNRSVYSAANKFASYISHLPHVTIIGDTTGGGGGAPISSELPNGWRLRYTVTQVLDAEMEATENGIPPDIIVNMNPADAAKGKDTILEIALAFIQAQ